MTLTGAVITGAAKYDGGKGLSTTAVRWIKGIQAEEKAHYDYLVAAGAQALTLTFTIPQSLVGITNNSATLLNFVVSAETIFIGAYAAAAQEFAQLKQPTLAKIALEILGVEAEHRTLAHYLTGAVPPNNLDFESAPYHNVAEAAAAVKNLGLLGTLNPAATLSFNTFANSVDFSGVSDLKPQ